MAEGGSNKDDSDGLLYGLLGLIIAIILIGVLLDKIAWLINALLGSIAWLHVAPFALIGDTLPFLFSIPIIGTHFLWPCSEVATFLSFGNFQAMSDEQRSLVMGTAGKVAVLVYGPILIRAAISETDVHVDMKYKKIYDLESMLREQTKTWKVVRMFKALDPLKSSEVKPSQIAKTAVSQLRKSKSAAVGSLISGFRVMSAPSGYKRSMTPEEWLVANGVTVSERIHDKLVSGKMPATERDFTFPSQWEYISIPSISEVLRSQLRTPWKGSKALKPSMRALFAVMVLFYSSKNDDANKMLGRLGEMANTLPTGKPGMDRIIAADKAMQAQIEKICASKEGGILEHVIERNHAWVESAFPTLLRMARFERGVFASASFIWLKQEDRLMWYILNSTGNDTAFVEAAGALAHNKAEIQLSGPLRRPHVYQAARAILHDYLNCSPEAVEKRRATSQSKRRINTQVSMMAADAEARHKALRNEGDESLVNAYTDLSDRAALSKIQAEYASEDL